MLPLLALATQTRLVFRRASQSRRGAAAVSEEWGLLVSAVCGALSTFPACWEGDGWDRHSPALCLSVG